MQKDEAVLMAKTLKKSGKVHKDYDRVTKLADEYLTLITGENTGKLLMQFVRRESKELFDQRCRLTQSITPAVANSIISPFYKVSRNDKVKRRIDFSDEKKNKAIEDMANAFYGSKRKKTRGLAYWQKTRFVELTFADPNAWVVTEWDAVEPTQIPEPHPFEVTAREAVNFKIENQELKWLFVKLGIIYTKINQKGEEEEASGLKYTLYDQDFTVVICQVCPKKIEKDGYILQEGEELITDDSQNTFLLSVYEPKLGYVPAFRVGYCRDTFTSGRTFVNPFHPAMAFFRKSIKTVSELDLTMTLHAFPQKLQYVQPCPGKSKAKKCTDGYTPDGEICEACKGTGIKVHTSAQDAIYLPMPDNKTDMIPLKDILEYKQPDTGLIKFQDEYIKGLKVEAHLAIFNSQIFINPNAQVQKTATEVDTNMQGIYDALEPFTEKLSEVWKEFIYTFAHLLAVKDPESFDLIHQYPQDLKLKTTGVLLQELKQVNDSGAPSFMRDNISEELAEIIYAGDELGYKKYSTKHRFFPFNGKTPDEIAVLMASEHVSRFTKVLYANFEAIFTDIALENPKFWFLDSYSKQWTILEAKVFEYIKELDEQQPMQINFGSDINPGANKGNPEPGKDATKGEGNPGDGEGDDDKDPLTDKEIIE